MKVFLSATKANNDALELDLLRHSEQRVEISFLVHQFVEAPSFGDTSIFEGQYTVIPLQQVFVQSVGDYDAGQVVQI